MPRTNRFHRQAMSRLRASERFINRTQRSSLARAAYSRNATAPSDNADFAAHLRRRLRRLFAGDSLMVAGALDARRVAQPSGAKSRNVFFSISLGYCAIHAMAAGSDGTHRGLSREVIPQIDYVMF